MAPNSNVFSRLDLNHLPLNLLLNLPFLEPVPTLSQAQVLVPLALSLCGFLGYWWAHYSAAIESWFDSRWPGDGGKVKRVFSLKVWGFVSMGVIPAWVLKACLGWSWADLGLRWPAPASNELWLWWCALIVSTVILSVVAGKEGAKNYPQIRAQEWSLMTMIWSGLGWSVYLVAYEFMFRGYLLFPLVSELGVWPAVAISTMLYSITHFHKGKGETLWCIPVGVMTCWMTLETGSLFHAATGHIVVSWFNTAYHVRRNPTMRWVGLRKG